jgi:hypothetical protein
MGANAVNAHRWGILAGMYWLEQALLVLALVGACGLTYRLMRGEASGGSCHSGGSCGCDDEPAHGPKLSQITRPQRAKGGGGDRA